MKRLTRACLRGLEILTLCFLASASTAHGHEFILKPAQFRAQPGEKISFSIIPAHVFMVSDAMEPLKNVKVALYEGAKITPVALRENRQSKTLDGEVSLSVKGSAILAGYLEEPVEHRPAKEGQVAARIKREKWSKAFLTGDAPDEHYGKILGHQLEIVPLANPFSIKAGQELSVRVLLDGKPLNAMVFATYDGFSPREYTYAYATEAKDGWAHIKFVQPGVWMVRVENRRQVNHKEYDQQVLKATLVLAVR